MRLAVGTAWSAVAADVADPQTASILTRVFRAMPAPVGSSVVPVLLQVGEASEGTVPGDNIQCPSPEKTRRGCCS